MATIPTDLRVGDLVYQVKGKILHCATMQYPHAVVVSVNPFVLASVSGDMVWSCTVKPEEFRVGGHTPNAALIAAFSRYCCDLRGQALSLKRRNDALQLEIEEAAELNSEMKALFDQAANERDAAIVLLRRSEVYLVAHIVAGEGALDECQEAGGNCREIVDDINEAKSLLAEVRSVFKPTTEDKSDDMPL